MASPAGYLRLLRWPGAVTAAANAATGHLLIRRLLPPGADLTPGIAVTIGAALVYLGGVALNDVADADLDREAHPTRPLPSGTARRGPAALLGLALVVAGCGLSLLLAGSAAGLATCAAAFCAVVYDVGAKRWRLPGALAMGGARGANAVAGMLASGVTLDATLRAAHATETVYPVVVAGFTVLLTLVSTREGRRPTAVAAGAMALVLVLPIALAWPAFTARWWWAPALPIVALTASLVAGAREAQVEPGPGVGAIVRRGVFGFLLVDSAFLMGSNWYEAGFWLLLAYVGLRLSLARLRS